MKIINHKHKEYQEYGIDAKGSITHAGVVNAPRMSKQVAKKIQNKWQVWRKQYLRDNPGDYPLRHTKPTVQLLIHPIGHPEQGQYYKV